MSSSHPRSNRITNSREMVEGNQAMKLYSHPSSSCSRRVRLALKLKGLEYDCIDISSTSDPGEITTRYMHFTLRNLNGKTHILYQNGIKFYTISKTNIVKDELLEVNPMGYVPALVDGTAVISDSYAILLYLEEKYPMHPLLPKDLTTRAINYQIASIVSSSVQPLQNMTLVNYIGEIAGLEEKLPWAQHHIRKGFIALEKLLVNYVGKYATGDDIYLADLYLAPQLHNAINRYKVDMTEFPLLISLNETYSKVPSFQQIMD